MANLFDVASIKRDEDVDQIGDLDKSKFLARTVVMPITCIMSNL